MSTLYLSDWLDLASTVWWRVLDQCHRFRCFFQQHLSLTLSVFIRLRCCNSWLSLLILNGCWIVFRLICKRVVWWPVVLCPKRVLLCSESCFGHWWNLDVRVLCSWATVNAHMRWHLTLMSSLSRLHLPPSLRSHKWSQPLFLRRNYLLISWSSWRSLRLRAELIIDRDWGGITRSTRCFELLAVTIISLR